mgnify:CR=1 FL=1
MAELDGDAVVLQLGEAVAELAAVSHRDHVAVLAFGDREAELGLRQKLADECGFSKSTAKARIEETRHALSDPDDNMRKLMDDNGTSSLARKREG